MAIIFEGLGEDHSKPEVAVKVTNPETGETIGEGGSLEEALRKAGREKQKQEVVDALVAVLPEDQDGKMKN